MVNPPLIVAANILITSLECWSMRTSHAVDRFFFGLGCSVPDFSVLIRLDRHHFRPHLLPIEPLFLALKPSVVKMMREFMEQRIHPKGTVKHDVSPKVSP